MFHNGVMSRTVALISLLCLAACSGSSEPEQAVDAAPAPTESSTTTLATTVAPEATTSSSTTAPEETTTTVPLPVRPTIDELITSGRVLNIAHAGGDQEWPHSTFHAFDNAVTAGADVLEMDVQLSADGILVVHHDETVDRTAGATGRVDEYTFEELAALDNAYWFVPGCWSCPDRSEDNYPFRGVRTGDVPPPDGASPDDFRIVRFAEVVERYPEVAFDVEIKGSGEAAAAAAEVLAAEIAESGITESIVVVSFDDATVETFRSLAPDVEVSPGVATLAGWLLEGVPLEGYRVIQVPPMYGDLAVITPEFWEAVAAAGVTVWMWPNDAGTQENGDFYQEMIDQGVTGIIAGRPSEVPD
jgi:glycerophosphoryl diester phosphodiesterase